MFRILSFILYFRWYMFLSPILHTSIFKTKSIKPGFCVVAAATRHVHVNATNHLCCGWVCGRILFLSSWFVLRRSLPAEKPSQGCLPFSAWLHEHCPAQHDHCSLTVFCLYFWFATFIGNLYRYRNRYQKINTPAFVLFFGGGGSRTFKKKNQCYNFFSVSFKEQLWD